MGHFRAQGVPLKRKLREFPVTEDALLPVGTPITVRHFVPGQYVDVTGISRGKGFQVLTAYQSSICLIIYIFVSACEVSSQDWMLSVTYYLVILLITIVHKVGCVNCILLYYFTNSNNSQQKSLFSSIQ